jgi:hypothetical protein
MTNKTDRHDITEILLKVALNPIHQPTVVVCPCFILAPDYLPLLSSNFSYPGHNIFVF